MSVSAKTHENKKLNYDNDIEYAITIIKLTNERNIRAKPNTNGRSQIANQTNFTWSDS